MTMLTDPSKKYRSFKPVHLRDRTWPDALITKAPIWLSTDLRDGNQALIEPMNRARKLRMFEQLIKIDRFDEIVLGTEGGGFLRNRAIRGNDHHDCFTVSRHDLRTFLERQLDESAEFLLRFLQLPGHAVLPNQAV